MTGPETAHGPQEISIQARWCHRTRYHTVGDLLTFRSGFWMVKGLYLSTTLSGERELYYILAEAALSSERGHLPSTPVPR